MLITILVIIMLCFVVGIYLGSLIFGKKIPEGVCVKQKKIDLLEQKLKDAPMVRTFEFRQSLTKAKLMEDVLKPSWVEFAHHWDCILEFDDRIRANLDKLADRIMSWYNPEYSELLLIAHNDDKIGFTIDFTWKKPKQKPSVFICPKEAVEGLEKYYEDELGNPMVLLGNQKD